MKPVGWGLDLIPANPTSTQERVPMSLYLIAGLSVAFVWLVESIVFLAGYKHSLSS